MTIRFSDDTEHVKEIQKRLRGNGYYCPCRLEKNEKTKCMCEEFRQMAEGVCHCGLFVKVAD